MSFNNISLDLVCFVCLSEVNKGDAMYSIHNEENDGVSILDKISSCLHIQISTDWNIPDQICYNCLVELTSAYEFQRKCQMSIDLYKSNNDEASVEIKLKGENFYRIPPGLEIKKLKSQDPDGFLNDNYCDDNLIVEETSFIEDESSEYVVNDLFDEDHHESNKCKEEDERSIKCKEEEEEMEDDKDVDCIETIESQELNENDNSMEYEVLITDNLDNDDDETLQKSNEESNDSQFKIEKVNQSHIPPEIRKIKKKYSKQMNGQKPPKMCEICGNSYKYQHALDSHMRRHRNERPFQCDFCDKSFVANVELQRHMRVHTRQKPYGCKYCERTFSDFGSRIKHERSHTGERPYKCKTCDKCFAYAHVLSVHNLTHTGEKKFKCTACGKGFTKKAYLKAHEVNKNCKFPKTQLYDGCNNEMKQLLMNDSNTSSNNLYDNIIIEEPQFGDENDDMVTTNFASIDYVISHLS